MQVSDPFDTENKKRISKKKDALSFYIA